MLKGSGIDLIPASAPDFFHRGHSDRSSRPPGTRRHRAIREGFELRKLKAARDRKRAREANPKACGRTARLTPSWSHWSKSSIAAIQDWQTPFLTGDFRRARPPDLINLHGRPYAAASIRAMIQ
jgi:hypothetical protein